MARIVAAAMLLTFALSGDVLAQTSRSKVPDVVDIGVKRWCEHRTNEIGCSEWDHCAWRNGICVDKSAAPAELQRQASVEIKAPIEYWIRTHEWAFPLFGFLAAVISISAFVLLPWRDALFRSGATIALTAWVYCAYSALNFYVLVRNHPPKYEILPMLMIFCAVPLILSFPKVRTLFAILSRQLLPPHAIVAATMGAVLLAVCLVSPLALPVDDAFLRRQGIVMTTSGSYNYNHAEPYHLWLSIKHLVAEFFWVLPGIMYPIALSLLAILVFLLYTSALSGSLQWQSPTGPMTREPSPFVPVPARPSPPPSLQRNPATPRDTPTAHHALRLAWAFIQEATEANFNDDEAKREARTSVALAAKQLEAAFKADPDAFLEIEDEQVTLHQADLRSRTLVIQSLLADSPAKSIEYARQATEADPSNAHAHFVLGSYHLDQRHKKEAIAALQAALALTPNDVKYQKSLIRAEAITAAEIASFKATQAAATTAIATIKTWRVLKLIGVLCLVIAVLTPFYWFASSFTEHERAQGRDASFIGNFLFIVFGFLAIGFVFRGWNRIKQWYAGLG